MAATRRFSPAARQFLIFSLLVAIAFDIFNLVFNLYMSALGFSNAIIGIFNSLPALALLGIGLPAAAFADRIGYRWFLLGATGLALLGSVVLALVGQPLVAVLSAGTFALGIITLSVLGSPLLAQVSQDAERVSLFAINQSLGWLAALVGFISGGLIPEAAGRAGHASSASAGSIRSAFIATTLLLLVAIPFLLRLTNLAGARPATVMPIRNMLQVDVRRFARLLLPEFIIGIGAGMFLTFVQLYFAQRFGLTPGPIGLILGFGAALTAIGTLASPWLSRRFGLTRTVGVTQMVGFPLILTLAFVFTLPAVVVVFYVRQIALNIQAPLANVFQMEYVLPEQRARAATAANIVWGIGSGGIGPLLSGLLQVVGGFQLAFSVAAVFYLLAGGLFLVLFGKVRVASERVTL